MKSIVGVLAVTVAIVWLHVHGYIGRALAALGIAAVVVFIFAQFAEWMDGGVER